MKHKNSFEHYANEVVSYLGCSARKAATIKGDILQSLEQKSEQTGETDPVKLMGEPEEVAGEFMENLNITPQMYQYEYRSKTHFKGIPLVHINRRRGGTAKGIIAVGSVAIGVISVGALSIGVLSLGGISLGLCFALGGVAAGGVSAFGGLALSLLYAFGGMAISFAFSFGGFALSNNVAVGGYASGKELAVGGVAKGFISVFNQNGTGEHLFDANQYPLEEIIRSIKMIKPETSDFVLNIVRNFSGF